MRPVGASPCDADACGHARHSSGLGRRLQSSASQEFSSRDGSPLPAPRPKEGPVRDTTRQPLLGAICALAGPAVLSFLLPNFYHVNDAYFLGRTGPEATNAMGLFQIVSIANFAFILTLARGTQSLVARRFGAGNLAGCRSALAQGLRLALLVLVPIGLLEWIFIPDMLRAMGGEGATVVAGTQYIRNLLLFLPALFGVAAGGVLVPGHGRHEDTVQAAAHGRQPEHGPQLVARAAPRAAAVARRWCAARRVDARRRARARRGRLHVRGPGRDGRRRSRRARPGCSRRWSVCASWCGERGWAGCSRVSPSGPTRRSRRRSCGSGGRPGAPPFCTRSWLRASRRSSGASDRTPWAPTRSASAAWRTCRSWTCWVSVRPPGRSRLTRWARGISTARAGPVTSVRCWPASRCSG